MIKPADLVKIVLTVILLSGCAYSGEQAPATSAVSRGGADADARVGVGDAASAYIDQWSAENKFNGVIAVRGPKGATTVHVGGVADVETGRTLTERSVFQTGSIDKFFASIAVFALAEKGVLDIDAPITTYLPSYRADTGGQLTLAHLMTNRSGLSDDYHLPMGQVVQLVRADPTARDYPLTLDQGIEAFGSGDLKFTPGAEFDYVHVNWILIRKILERVTGKSYLEILQSYVFAPAGMERSGVFVWDLTQSAPKALDAAIGYNESRAPMSSDWPLPAFVGGGTYTTARDMLALFSALYGGDIIGPESLERFSTVTTEAENYAYGGRVIYDDGAPNEGYSSQSGSNGATNIVAIHKIAGGYSFVALSNFAHDQGEMFALSRALETMISE